MHRSRRPNASRTYLSPSPSPSSAGLPPSPPLQGGRLLARRRRPRAELRNRNRSDAGGAADGEVRTWTENRRFSSRTALAAAYDHESTVGRIRANFLDVLHDALTTETPLSLDFVYGDVVGGTLSPLDGQQRLTTLFLLHWYLAWRADRLDEAQGWKRFAYATRPSARRFCACLVESKPALAGDLQGGALRAWFVDQPWFLHTWQHDPTIESMLVMLEAMHQRFTETDCSAAWDRLVDPARPAISFHLLPIEEMGLGEDVYIKMNSRGKPLTPFENFKARFEQVLERSCPKRAFEFAKEIDDAWASCLLWPFSRRRPPSTTRPGATSPFITQGVRVA